MSTVFNLINQDVRARACAAIMSAGDNQRVEIKERTRSLDQNAKLHALLNEIARSIEWAGAYRSVDTWKRLLTAAWLRSNNEHVEILPAIDGHGVDIVFTKTSSLSVTKMIDLIEFIQAWHAEHEVTA